MSFQIKNKYIPNTIQSKLYSAECLGSKQHFRQVEVSAEFYICFSKKL